LRTTFRLAACAIALASCGRGDLTAALPDGAVRASRGAPASGYRVLYAFAGAPDGAQPESGLLAYNGVLLGTTYGGGNVSGCGNGEGCGTVFRVKTSGVEKILHRFAGGSDGANPLAGLAETGGTFYGTTQNGGSSNLGTVFSVSPLGAERTIYAFAGIPDGAKPEAELTVYRGTLFGTTYGGGISGCFGSPTGCGTAFSVRTTGQESVLHRFGVRPDGALPQTDLVMVRGTFYGTTTKRTTNEGGGICGAGDGCGVVFRMDAAGNESVVYRFLKPPDASTPESGLVPLTGLFYGTTPYGGASEKGTVYLVNASGGEQVVHSFKGYGDGANPFAGLIVAGGVLYGTTYNGGRQGDGTIFRIDGSGNKTVLHDFKGGGDGSNPRGKLAMLDGVLYGTTEFGGPHNAGTVFAVSP